ncbi:uncharacterized protein LOC143049177 isoform X1 [Mytilus galloprovincialis]|uniref:Uncharacterized protein n=1 Tax=Mytilus galloprovincialis TaxID=29158 RepID=A0A8B6FDA5_MYTGA|nr:Hypothetical predicted protein [Mytilus galloprovincialis]
MYNYKENLIYFIFVLIEVCAGVTEFPCQFPCQWRNKTFHRFETTFEEAWTFSADGKTSMLGDSEGRQNFSCYQITERFLILRLKDRDFFKCFPIFYDPSIPLEIKAGGWNNFYSTNKTGAFTDLCPFCKVPDWLFLWTADPGPPSTPLPLSLDCNRPSSCSPPGVVCNMSDTIPKTCPPTTEPTTTHSHCGKKKRMHPLN